MGMKTRRWISKPAEFSLLMPLLAILSTTVSLVALMMFLSDRENSKRELEIPLRLLNIDELAQAPNPATLPSITIDDDDIVKFNGLACETRPSKKLLELRAIIRAHSNKPDAAKIVIVMKPDSRYERLMDVLNALAACKCSHYQIAFYPCPPWIGPRSA